MTQKSFVKTKTVIINFIQIVFHERDQCHVALAAELQLRYVCWALTCSALAHCNARWHWETTLIFSSPRPRKVMQEICGRSAALPLSAMYAGTGTASPFTPSYVSSVN